MDGTLNAEESTIIATYSSRRDAEVARDYLADNDLRTFVSADDAGGMHPQMQRPNGVKLIGMSSTAEDARALLEDVDLAPPARERSTGNGAGAASEQEWVSSSGLTTAALIVAIVVIALILLGIF